LRFTDKAARKRRPAPVLSDTEVFNHLVDHRLMAMITSARRQASLASGLTDRSVPSVIRLMLFTLDRRFVLRRVTRLLQSDQRSFRKTFLKVYGV
jgi:mRNA interferase MazF